MIVHIDYEGHPDMGADQKIYDENDQVVRPDRLVNLQIVRILTKNHVVYIELA